MTTNKDKWTLKLMLTLALVGVVLAAPEDWSWNSPTAHMAGNLELRLHNVGNTMNSNASNTHPSSSVAIGRNNDVNSDSILNKGCGIAVGWANTIKGSDSITVGLNNQNKVDETAVVGYGLILPPQDVWGAVLVGRWNNSLEYAGNPIVFGVGRGDGNDQRNAMTIYKNGRIVINDQQGDISMGGYGN